jgi:hypothetical protein
MRQLSTARREGSPMISTIRHILFGHHQTEAIAMISIDATAIRKLARNHSWRYACRFRDLVGRHILFEHDGKQRLSVLQRHRIPDTAERFEATL